MKLRLTLRTSLVLLGFLTMAGSAAHAITRLSSLEGPRWVDRVNVLAGDGALLILGILVVAGGIRVRRGLADQLRYLMTERPVATALVGGLFFLGVLAVAVETTLETLDARKPHPEEVQSGTFTTDFFVDDPVLGYGPARDFRATSVKQIDGKTVYDVVYTVDGEGRRITTSPAAASAVAASEVAEGPDGPVVLFFGCSNTFGEGVQDWETLSSCYAALAPSTTVYNYGFCGYGPQQMLAMIEDGRLDDVVGDRDVIAVYLYIDAHVARVVGSMIVTTTWGIDMPLYALNGANELERRGSFRTGRSWQNWAYALLSRYQTFRVFGRDLPPLRDSHFALTARIIKEAAKELRTRARSARFYLALHPQVLTRDRLVPHLRGREVQVLDHVGLYDPNDGDYMIAGDWHPTPLAYRTIAAAIARDVELAGSGPPPGR